MKTSSIIFVGREKELELIREKVTGDTFEVVFIQGGAGIGKTKLLERCEPDFKVKNPGDKFLFFPIIDFYDTSKHSEIAIFEILARFISRQISDHMFSQFNLALMKYQEGRVSEAEVWDKFLLGYNQATIDKRFILRFDTAELLVYEKDAQEVLDDCQPEGLEAPALDWFKKYGALLPNTVILIAGRPHRDLVNKLATDFDTRLIDIELGGLNHDEIVEYFNAYKEFGEEVTASIPDLIRKIELLTDGRPILLALALNWLNWGMWDKAIYATPVDELEQKKQNKADEWNELLQHFERLLVQNIRNLKTPLDITFKYAARARKGFNAEILKLALNNSYDPDQIIEIIDKIKDSPLIMIPHVLPDWRKEWFYLHDELYDLVEAYVWNIDYPGFAEQVKIAKKISGYYQTELNNVDNQFKEAKTTDERSILLQKKYILTTENLYYLFEIDPKKGLLEFDKLENQAINKRALEWENALRIEMFRFLRQRTERARSANLVKIDNGNILFSEQVNQNCRIQWVQRFGARNNFEKAIKIGENMLKKYQDWPALWRLRILISVNSSKTRLGQLGTHWMLDDVQKDLTTAIDQIKDIAKTEENEWLLDHLESTAYVHPGLINRARGDLAGAVAAYDQAIARYQKMGYDEGYARALNNLAYVLARQGKTAEAKIECKKALDLRKKIGDERGFGLSLNTLGVIKIFDGDEEGAVLDSRQAANIFNKFNDNMGLALAFINLGRVHRRLGLKDMRRTPDEVRKLYFERALYYLNNAEEYKDILEPYYKATLYNEKGCTFKDWANYIALHKGNKDEYHTFMEKASKEFELANEIAVDKLPLIAADNLEDWAWVFHLRSAYCEDMNDSIERKKLLKIVENKLNDAEKLINKFQSKKQQGLEAHFFLGKIYFQRALLLIKFKKDLQQISNYFAQACAFLETYSADAVELKEVLMSIDRWLNSPKIEQSEASEIANNISKELQQKKNDGWQVDKSLNWIEDVVKYMVQRRMEDGGNG